MNMDINIIYKISGFYWDVVYFIWKKRIIFGKS